MPVIHPFLIALIPILYLLASNPGQARFSDALIPILTSLGFTLVAFVTLGLVLKNWEASGLIVSLFLVMFFSTGHLADFFLTKYPQYLLFVFVGLCVILAAGAFIVVKFRDRLRNPTRILNVVAATLMAIVLLNLFTSGTHRDVTV